LQAENNDERLNGISWNYGAPENILHCCFDFHFENTVKSDIWSLGIVFHRIFIDNLNIIFPWSSFFARQKRIFYDQQIKNEIQKEKLKKNQYISSNSPNLPWEIVALINECLQAKFETTHY